jgi:hypothetical protein
LLLRNCSFENILVPGFPNGMKEEGGAEGGGRSKEGGRKEAGMKEGGRRIMEGGKEEERRKGH